VPYYSDRALTKEEVEEWLRKASCSELNIYYNTNEIITLLCRELLKNWKEDENKNEKKLQK